MMYGKRSSQGYSKALEGIEIKTLCHGASTLMSEFRLEGGASLPEHAHPNEQTGYLVRGRMRLFIGGESRELESGDSWCVPANARHRAEIVEDSIAIEVFSPPREDYLTYENAADIVE
jgi:quercetin dioxygenase-like cupin family protein